MIHGNAMKRLLGVTALIVALAACGARPSAERQPAAREQYQLVWSDEFNADGPLNLADWGYEQGFVRNRELQWYQRENAICKDGYLVIEARREQKPNPKFDPVKPLPAGPHVERGWRNRKTIEYTSASVTTRGKREWAYGRFEIRAKIDVRPGSWPAFWTLGTSGPWPANGEIDIMEYYRGALWFNVAWAGTPTPPGGAVTWNTKRVPLDSLANDWADHFHRWRMDWTPQSIKLYLDDALVNEQDLHETFNREPLPPGALPNPFLHGRAYLLLNQAIGGTNGGDPTGIEFPVRYLIDYVRVWQIAGQAGPASTRPQSGNNEND
jgi:beta-glucanase (GH16 family)